MLSSLQLLGSIARGGSAGPALREALHACCSGIALPTNRLSSHNSRADACYSTQSATSPSTHDPLGTPPEVSTSAPAGTLSDSWPFLDTGRPNHLPRLVTNKKRPEAVPLLKALELVKANAKCKFPETLEMHVRLKVDPRQGDQMVRGAVVLPYGTGKSVRVCVFATGAAAEAAAAAGADVVGDQSLIDKIAETKGGCIDFDKCVATPDFMKHLGKVGKILGPRGMMPNPKVGTMTMDVAAAVRDMRRGRVEYRVDKGSIVHLPLGKVNFPTDHLYANIGAAAQSLLESKPKVVRSNGLSGYVKQVHMASSMGPSVLVQLSSLVAAMEAAAPSS